MLYAMQLKDVLKMGEATYVAILLEEANTTHSTFSEAVSMFLDEFTNLILVELPKSLSLKCVIDH